MAGTTESGECLDASLNVAMVGMAARFPGAPDVARFWQRLCAAEEMISFFSDDELRAAGVSQSDLDDPSYVKAAPVLENIDRFDAAFFDYTPTEANLMDPQQRILLECTWQALEHAGYGGEKRPGPIGIFAGVKMNTYVANLLTDPTLMAEPQNRFQVMLGNAEFALATRIAYKLNLRGPSYMLQTACSTSLAAIHLACQSLLLDECRMALAGGVAVDVPHRVGYHYQPGGPASPDGHCRPFDARAQGTVFGNGVGMVVLRRLEDALADRDTIYAVIKGTAVNNDGAVKASFTAPSVEGQTDVILEALACASVAADSISYVEAHGTGTPLGDPIEVQALTKAYRASTSERGFCRLGSVKGNVGHLDVAAGLAGLLKTVLALGHRQIPPTLHFEQPNPEINFATSPFYVSRELVDWPDEPAPRRAGVSSFGFGGANAHVILEEAPEIEPSGASRPAHLLTMSTRTAAALDQAVADLAAFFEQNPGVNMADAAYTLHAGRRPFVHRRIAVCRDPVEGAELLRAADVPPALTAVQQVGDPPVVFMFPGQGAQYANMTAGLYEVEPTYRQWVDRCSQAIEVHLGLDLRTILFPQNAQVRDAVLRLEQTEIAQPAIFVTAYALARLWMSWNVTPRAMIGHSIGEYVAACLAGVFELEDALALVAARGRLMQQMDRGSMLGVPLPADELLPLLDERISLAAANAPDLSVVSGPAENIDALQERLAARDVTCRCLHTSHAFHSASMEPVLASLAEEVRARSLNPPDVPFVSNVTGRWITAAEATDPGYWARHARETVRFADGIGTLLEEPHTILLEVGPGRTLSTFARRQQDEERGTTVLTSVRHPKQQTPDTAFLLATLGKLWLAGVEIDWEAFHAHERRRRIPLPTYPFQRQRYWVEAVSDGRPASRASRGKNPNVDDWFYALTWQEVPLPAPFAPAGQSRWLLFVDGHGLGAMLAETLRAREQTVVTAEMGEAFRQNEDGTYTLNPGNRDHYGALLQSLKGRDLLPHCIVHLWSVTGEDGAGARSCFDGAQETGYYGGLFLVQALAQEAPGQAVRLGFVTDGLHQIGGMDPTRPEKATLVGLCKVAAQELVDLQCTCIDVILPEPGTRHERRLVDDLLADLVAGADPMIAYRGGRRWTQTYHPAPLHEDDVPRRPLREHGVYWIAGGLGKVGYLIAQHLARTVQARLVLSARSGLPPRDRWDTILAAGDEETGAAQGIRRVRALEALGAEVMVAAADVADEEETADLVAQITDRFGQLNGIVHAAGVTSGPSLGRPLTQMEQDDAETQFHAKARGVYAIDRAVAGRSDVDFCLLCSSTSAVLGGLGFVTYAAANAFLDAFAIHRSRNGSIPWISADWDPWPVGGEQFAGQQASAGQYAMTVEEGQEAFRRAACLAREGQVVVVTGDMAARFDRWITRVASGDVETSTARERPPVSSTYVAPRNPTEETVATIWARVLGIERVGVHDDFFELGGHSLLVTQLLNEVRKTFRVELAMQSLFERSTVADVAALIEESRSPAGDGGKPIALQLHEAFLTERQGMLEEYLREEVARAAGIDAGQLPASGSLEALDVEWIAVNLVQSLRKSLDQQFYLHEIRTRPSIPRLARFILAEMERMANLPALATQKPLSAYKQKPWEPAAGKAPPEPGEQNRSIVFLHSSPRAGSTLLRIMLAGHAELFCPPELHLLFFDTMQEWDQNIGFGQDIRWQKQGLHTALIELLQIDPQEGWALLDDWVARNRSVQSVYARLQELAGRRLLVDKTPTYSMGATILARSESLFDAPRHIFLTRHPYAVIESFLRIRLDRGFGPSLFEEEDVDPYVIAETVWATCNRNLLQFLDSVEAERSLRVRYEDLVARPAETMEAITRFLGVPFNEAVLNPYDGRRERMIGSLGDPNIFDHEQIDASLAAAWKEIELPRRLDESTVETAVALGYDLPGEDRESSPDGRVSVSAEDEAGQAQLLSQIDRLSGEEVSAMLKRLLAEQEKE